MAERFILFTCPKCNRPLLWTYATASVYCNKCNYWVSAKTNNNNNGKVELDPEDNQILLF